MRLGKLSASAFGLTLVCVSNAFAVTVTVPGSANPFLAGYPIGGSITQTNDSTDTAPSQSPVDVMSVFGGERLNFSNITGSVVFDTSYDSSYYSGPNGRMYWPSAVSASWGTTVGGYTNFPINALVGIFYSAAASQGPVNNSLQSLLYPYGNIYELATAAQNLTPALNQIFFVGNGSLGTFTAPSGATTLYLGTVDGYQWNNNGGSFTATVTAVPGPIAGAGLPALLGLLGFGFYRRRRAV